MPIWSIDNTKLSFLDLSYYDFSESNIRQINVTDINREVSGSSFSPNGGNYVIFEIGDENRKAGLSKTTEAANKGIQLPTMVDVYEPRWSPVPLP